MPADANADSELQAIQTILSVLGDLDSQARTRVVDYVFRRLGVTSQESTLGLAELGAGSVMPEPSGTAPTLPRPETHDIRSLKEEKDPKSAVEMAAIVAYYLAELAPPSERKKTVTTADLEKYFKQARYPLPKALRVSLARAATSGYFDSVARGQYRLNPVGYNLVSHGLPGKVTHRRSASAPKATGQHPIRRRAKSRKRASRKSK